MGANSFREELERFTCKEEKANEGKEVDKVKVDGSNETGNRNSLDFRQELTRIDLFRNVFHSKCVHLGYICILNIYMYILANTEY